MKTCTIYSFLYYFLSLALTYFTFFSSLVALLPEYPDPLVPHRCDQPSARLFPVSILMQTLLSKLQLFVLLLQGSLPIQLPDLRNDLCGNLRSASRHYCSFFTIFNHDNLSILGSAWDEYTSCTYTHICKIGFLICDLSFPSSLVNFLPFFSIFLSFSLIR